MERECECELKLGLYKVKSSYHDTKCQYSNNGTNDNKIEIEGQGLSKNTKEQNKYSEIKRSHFDSDENLKFKNIQSNCTCKLNLGVFKFSEIEGSYYDTKQVHEKIFRNEELKSKIDEMKSKSSQGIFDENIIAIPNYILLPEKVESFLGICENENLKKIQSYAQDVLHQSIINAVRYLNMKAFVMKQFQSHLIFGLISKNAVKENKECGDHLDLTSHDVELIKVLSSDNIDELLNKVETTEIDLEHKERLNQCLKDNLLDLDSLVILPELRLIINIQLNLKEETEFLVKDAFQSNRNISVMKKIFQPLLSDEWELMTAICAPKLEDKKKDISRGCTNCKSFIFGEKEILDMKSWIGRIVKEQKGNLSNDRPDPYVLMIDTICLSLINNMTSESGKANKLVTSLEEHSKETEDMFLKNIVNLELVDNSTPSIVVIDGDYGVGKTYCLQERAKCVSQEDPSCEIAYINLSSYTSKNTKAKTITDLVAKNMKAKTITDLVAEIMFEDYENIDVISTINLHKICPEGENIYELINRYFKVNGHYTHIFIDELPRPNKFALWHNIFQTGKQYCVTLKVNPSPFDDHEGLKWIKHLTSERKASHIILRDNKRNSENVVNSSDAIGWKRYHSNKNFLFPLKNIAGPTNFYYQNVQQLDNATLAIAAIQKYHAENIHEPVVILLENSDQVEQLYCNLKENLGNRNVLRVPLTETLDNHQEIRNFIIKPEGILITYSHAFNGAEARNIIIFQESHTNEVLRNLVLRAVSFAIIICNDKIEDAVKSVPGFTEDTNLHKYIAKFNKARVGKEIKNPKEITSGGIEPELDYPVQELVNTTPAHVSLKEGIDAEPTPSTLGSTAGSTRENVPGFTEDTNLHKYIPTIDEAEFDNPAEELGNLTPAHDSSKQGIDAEPTPSTSGSTAGSTREMEELGSGTKMDENTGPGSDTKKGRLGLLQHLPRKLSFLGRLGVVGAMLHPGPLWSGNSVQKKEDQKMQTLLEVEKLKIEAREREIKFEAEEKRFIKQMAQEMVKLEKIKMKEDRDKEEIKAQKESQDKILEIKENKRKLDIKHEEEMEKIRQETMKLKQEQALKMKRLEEEAMERKQKLDVENEENSRKLKLKELEMKNEMEAKIKLKGMELDNEVAKEKEKLQAEKRLHQMKDLSRRSVAVVVAIIVLSVLTATMYLGDASISKKQFELTTIIFVSTFLAATAGFLLIFCQDLSYLVQGAKAQLRKLKQKIFNKTARERERDSTDQPTDQNP